MTHTVDGQPTPQRHDPVRTDASATVATSTEGPDKAAKPRPRGGSRDPFFDNAKFVAIIFVALGHVIEDLRDIEALGAVYMFIYMFHMPVFIVITGYFSRNFTFSGNKAQKLITNLAVPYVVFEVAYSTYNWAVDGADFEITLLDPYYLTWFLIALFAWRLSTPVWQQIRWPLAVAVVISLLSGMNELPRELDMNRMLGMLPFFVLGLMLKPEHFEWLKRPAARVIGAMIMLGGLATAFVVRNRMTAEWTYWRHGNDWFNVDDATGSAMRLGLLVCSSLLVAGFLSLVPAKQRWFTRFGSLTLYTYLLHGFFTKGMEYLGWWDAEWMRTAWGLPLVLLGTITVAILLMTPPVRWLARWALEPRMPWAFTPPRRPRSRVHRGAHRAPDPRAAAAGKAAKSKSAGTPEPARSAASPPDPDTTAPADRRPLPDADPLGGATVTIASRDGTADDDSGPNLFVPSDASAPSAPAAAPSGPAASLAPADSSDVDGFLPFGPAEDISGRIPRQAYESPGGGGGHTHPPPPPQNPLPSRAAVSGEAPLPRDRGGAAPRRMRPPYGLAGERRSGPGERGDANGQSGSGAGLDSDAGSDAYPVVGSDSHADPHGDSRANALGSGPETTPDLDLGLDSSGGTDSEYDFGPGSGSAFDSDSDSEPESSLESGGDSSTGPDDDSESGSDRDTGPDRNG
jgi:fucose 4-O-acetylase-like acetyltransferase